MSRVTIDYALAASIRQSGGTVELRDPEGVVVAQAFSTSSGAVRELVGSVAISADLATEFRARRWTVRLCDSSGLVVGTAVVVPHLPGREPVGIFPTDDELDAIEAEGGPMVSAEEALEILQGR